MRPEEALHKTLSVNPFRCRMWPLHDRAEEHITEENCRDEIVSFEKYGQLVPALGRTLSGDPGYDVELIYGARRLFVARHLNVPLRVELRELADREALISMEIENRHRQDISPYERGLAYAAWLREGYFSSQNDLSSALGISAAQVSKLLKMTRLPAVILSAFPSVADISEGRGLELVAALEDPHRRDRIVRRARQVAAETVKPSADEVCRVLLSASSSDRRKPTVKLREEVVRRADGTPLFRVRYASTAVMLVLPTEQVSARGLKDIIRSVSAVVERESTNGIAVEHVQSKATARDIMSSQIPAE